MFLSCLEVILQSSLCFNLSITFQLTDIDFFPDMLDCNFDKDYCNWTNAWSSAPSFKWYRHKGPTPSRNTGPSGDHGTNNGKYEPAVLWSQLCHNANYHLIGCRSDTHERATMTNWSSINKISSVSLRFDLREDHLLGYIFRNYIV